MYDKLGAKVNNINTSGFILKTNYDTDKSDLEKKMPDTSRLLDYNATLSVSGLTTTSPLAVVENKIPHVSSLVKNIITQKLLKLKRNLLIITIGNILLLQKLINLQQKFLMQD